MTQRNAATQHDVGSLRMPRQRVEQLPSVGVQVPRRCRFYLTHSLRIISPRPGARSVGLGEELLGAGMQEDKPAARRGRGSHVEPGEHLVLDHAHTIDCGGDRLTDDLLQRNPDGLGNRDLSAPQCHQPPEPAGSIMEAGLSQ